MWRRWIPRHRVCWILALSLVGAACTPATPEEAAFVQERAPKGWGPPIIRGYYWKPTDTLLPEGSATDVMSVTIQATPSVVAAFGTSDNTGADLVHVRSYLAASGTWDVTAALPGSYAAISNNVLAVGTPGVNVAIYRAPTFGTKVSVTPTLPLASSDFGRSLAIDGSTLVVGAPGYNLQEGRAFIFEYLPSDLGRLQRHFWQQTAIIGEPASASPAVVPLEESLLGAAVGVSGTVVAVGQTPDAPDVNGLEGRVFLFEKQAAGWQLVDTVFAHDPSTGQIAPNTDPNADSFGKALVVKGETLAVRSDRYVQLFTRSVSSGAVHWAFTTSYDAGSSSSSHWDRPLAFDGEELLSGDSFENSSAGRVSPLQFTNAHPIPWVPPNPYLEEDPLESGAMFGQSIVTGGGWLLVGDRRAHVRVYERTPYY